jgi:undecaprenyl-diphosphatase
MRGGGYLLTAVLFASVVALGFAVNAGIGQEFDLALMKHMVLRDGDSPAWLIQGARFFTWAGDGPQRTIITVVLALGLLWARRFKAALVVPVVPAIGNAVSSILKEAFARPRPDIVPHLDQVTSLAFPSGHAAAGAVFLFAALIMPGKQPKLRLFFGLLLMALIGLSRPMLGVHWPTDVIGGWMMGFAFVSLGLAIIRQWEGRPIGKGK